MTADGVPMAVRSSTKDVIASRAVEQWCPAKTQAVATAATTYVARAREARGRIASRPGPIEYSISPALPTEPAEAARNSGTRYRDGAASFGSSSPDLVPGDTYDTSHVYVRYLR